MKSHVLCIAAVAALLAGCSTTTRTPTYDCPLDSTAASCASMEDAYKASRSMTRGEHTRVQSVFDARVQQGAAPQGANADPVVGARLSNYPEPGEQGSPVFSQPKVMRVWVAPYVDAEGNLRSGEYTYFSTPGSWNYGTLNKAGAGSNIMGPTKPDNLGFQPNLQSAKPANTSARPSAPPSAPAQAQAAAKSAQAQGAQPAAVSTDPSGTITQPYQRITN